MPNCFIWNGKGTTLNLWVLPTPYYRLVLCKQVLFMNSLVLCEGQTHLFVSLWVAQGRKAVLMAVLQLSQVLVVIACTSFRVIHSLRSGSPHFGGEIFEWKLQITFTILICPKSTRAHQGKVLTQFYHDLVRVKTLSVLLNQYSDYGTYLDCSRIELPFKYVYQHA